MDDWLRRYLDARRAACAARPALHAHELAAIAAGAADRLAEAEQLDRAAGMARIDAAIGDAPRDATFAFTRLVMNLIARDGAWAGRPEAAEQADADRAALLAADPAFAVTAHAYAARLPWDTPWFEAGDSPRDDPRAAGDDDVEAWAAGLGEAQDAPVGDLAAPFRALADAPAQDAVARATRDAAAALVAADEPTPELLTRFAAAGLRARAEEALARQAFWPDPLTERHWSGLIAALDAARTPTEVALIAHHAEGCLTVEADWNVLAHGALTAPLIAALAHDLEPDPARAEGVRRAAALTHRLTGLGPRAALREPWIGGLVGRDIGDHGTEEGEAGYDLVSASRVWSEQTGRPATPATVEAALDAVQAPEPAPEPRPPHRWERPPGPVDPPA